MVIGRLHCRSRLHVIRRIDDHHLRNCTHQSDIFIALMGGSIFTYGDSCMCGRHFYIQMRIADGISNLLKSPPRRKHCESTGKRNLSGCCDSRRNTHHIALCNSAVDMAFRKFLLKYCRFCRLCQIGVQDHQIFMLLSQFHQRVAIAFPGCNFLLIFHLRHLPRQVLS